MLRQTRAAGAGCLLRALRAYAIFVGGAVALAVAIGYALAARRVTQADEGWSRETESMEAFRARFPVAPDSPAATRLDEMARELGIRLTLRSGDPPKWTGVNDERIRTVDAALTRIERPALGAALDWPAAAEGLLEHERERLDAIVAHILEGGPVSWSQDVTKGTAAPIPSLLGHRQLSSLILGRAWTAARDGQAAETERMLEASWRLNAAYLERPELISQLVGMSVARWQHGVLRATRGRAPVWQERMAERPFGARLATALQLEASNWMLFTRAPWGLLDVPYMEAGQTPPGGWRTIPRFLTTPYMRLSLAGTSDALLQALRDLRRERRCDFDIEGYTKRFEDSIPRWNIVGRIATPSVLKVWTLLREADFDRELAGRVLLARAERAASRSWPAGGPSQSCEGLSWEYRPEAGGSLDIRPSAAPFRASTANWDWSYRVSP